MLNINVMIYKCCLPLLPYLVISKTGSNIKLTVTVVTNGDVIVGGEG